MSIIDQLIEDIIEHVEPPNLIDMIRRKLEAEEFGNLLPKIDEIELMIDAIEQRKKLSIQPRSDRLASLVRRLAVDVNTKIEYDEIMELFEQSIKTNYHKYFGILRVRFSWAVDTRRQQEFYLKIDRFINSMPHSRQISFEEIELGGEYWYIKAEINYERRMDLTDPGKFIGSCRKYKVTKIYESNDGYVTSKKKNYVTFEKIQSDLDFGEFNDDIGNEYDKQTVSWWHPGGGTTIGSNLRIKTYKLLKI